MTDNILQSTHSLQWRIHMPNLLKEILNNPGTAMLEKPLTILGHRLYDLAELAVKIDDPRLHLMMMDFALYSVGDPEETPLEEIRETREALMERIADMEDTP